MSEQPDQTNRLQPWNQQFLPADNLRFIACDPESDDNSAYEALAVMPFVHSMTSAEVFELVAQHEFQHGAISREAIIDDGVIWTEERYEFSCQYPGGDNRLTFWLVLRANKDRDVRMQLLYGVGNAIIDLRQQYYCPTLTIDRASVEYSMAVHTLLMSKVLSQRWAEQHRYLHGLELDEGVDAESDADPFANDRPDDADA